MKTLGMTERGTVIIEMLASEFKDYEFWKAHQPASPTDELAWEQYFRGELSKLNLETRVLNNLLRSSRVMRWPERLAAAGYTPTFSGWCDFTMTKRGADVLRTINDFSDKSVLALHRAIWERHKSTWWKEGD